MCHQAGEIEAVLTDRDSAAVRYAVDTEREAVLLVELVLVFDQERENPTSYIAQSDQGQPDSLHAAIPSR